jgi:hypothetical protein
MQGITLGIIPGKLHKGETSCHNLGKELGRELGDGEGAIGEALFGHVWTSLGLLDFPSRRGETFSSKTGHARLE